MTRPRILVTGAGGGVGQALWPQLAAEFDLRLLDRITISGADGIDCVVGDVTCAADVAHALRGVDAVVHLAGNRFTTASWDELVASNLVGQHRVLAIAQEVGVSRVVLASSCHASGRYDVERVPRVDPSWTPRPCCPYGVSKVYGEMAGRLLAETSGLQVIALRLGAVGPRPRNRFTAQFWLSHEDLYRAVSGALRTDVRYGVYYAGSSNVRERWNLEPGERDLGYFPADDSAVFAAEISQELGGASCYDGAL